MKAKDWRLILTCLLALARHQSASAQPVTATNLVTTSGERVLRIESVIQTSPKDVWQAFATEEGLRK